MPRTWSNAKRTDTLSAAQRARLGRPSSKTAFLVLLIIVSVFFFGLTFYTAWHAETHPPTDAYQPVRPQPPAP